MLRSVQGCAVIFDGCKPLEMGDIRKPRFSNVDVEKTMDGFFDSLLEADKFRALCVDKKIRETANDDAA